MRCASYRNVSQSDAIFDRLTMPSYGAQAAHCNTREFEPLRSVHGQQAHGRALGGDSIPIVLRNVNRHAMLGQDPSKRLADRVLGIQNSHLRPLIASLLACQQPFGDAVALCIEAHALPNLWFDSLSASALRQKHWILFVRCDARRAENFGREVSSERQDLSGIAVVDLEHSGSAFGFNSQLSPHRARPPLVDSLRVVIR